MRIDWRAANRFLLIAAAMLVAAWVLREVAVGSTIGAIDVIIALAVATVLTRSVTLPTADKP